MTVQLITASQPPAYAPGKLVKEFLDQSSYVIKSDAVLFGSTSPASIFKIPDNTLVLEVICQIVTAFNGLLATLSVGISGTAERHLAVADIDVTTVGFYKGEAAPYEYTTSNTLIATIGGTVGSTGKAYFWLRYRAKSNLQYNRP